MRVAHTYNHSHPPIGRTAKDIEDRDRLIELGQQLSGMFDPNQILPIVTATVCAALKVPHAAVFVRRLDTGEDELQAQHVVAPVAEARDDLSPRTMRTTVHHFPIVFHGETLGSLAVDTCDDSRFLDAQDVELLHEFVDNSAAAVRIVQLMEDLRRTRERVVLAREEERQRLRRNLHDGIGPTLAALIFRSGTLRKLVSENPAQAEAQLADYRDQLKAVITEIRRVVYNLRPPALDEIGMLRAINEQASQFSADDLVVTVDAPDRLPALHPAVEVAAYRIVCEAMSNVARHAQAKLCSVYIRVNDTAFLVEVRDDGMGIPPGQTLGVGFASMRERTSELGGTLTIESKLDGGGTLIRACLPMSLNAWVDLQAESSSLGQSPGPHFA